MISNSKYQLIWQLVRVERKRYAAAVTALVLASCFLYLVPLVPSAVLDGVLADNGHNASPLIAGIVSAAGGREFLRANLWLAAVLMTGFTALAGFFTYLRGRLSSIAAESVILRLRDRLYDQLQHLPCSYFDTAPTGDLVQRCTSDVETMRQFLVSQVVEIGRAVLMMLVPLPLMLAIDWRMTALSVVLIPPIVAFSMVFFRRVRTSFEKVDQAEGRLTATLQENLTGIRVVRAFARQQFEIEKFGARNAEHRDLDNNLYRILAVFWSASDVLCISQMGIVVIAGGRWIADGSLGVGSFFFFLTVVGMFIWPVRMMGRILTELGKATVAVGRIQEILGHPRETAPENRLLIPQHASGRLGEIVFRDVTFAHRKDTAALENVSFHLPAGGTLALFGPSGSGKSTIVNLLLRLYDPPTGVIEIDGRDIRHVDRKDVRRQISVVMQEPFLYSKTVRENLSIGHASATHDDIVQATAAACVHDTVMEFEQGYDTLVGERGITLSGGQRQRVALARALLKRPTILILDDALSAVDTETEAQILDALALRGGRCTTIVIAHRLSTLMTADEILVLDHGRIVQRGTHEQLKDVPGMYQRVWTIQNTMESV
jgi:ATP-binding cassette subfamily B protein